MVINEDTIKGKWLEIKGDIQKTWGKITADEFEKTHGDLKAIAGLVQQKYGEDKEVLNKKLTYILEQFNSKKDKAAETIKTELKK